MLLVEVVKVQHIVIQRLVVKVMRGGRRRGSMMGIFIIVGPLTRQTLATLRAIASGATQSLHQHRDTCTAAHVL